MGAVFALVAVCAGMASALQSGFNQMLQKSLSAPLWTVALVSTITLCSAVSLALMTGQRLPQGSAMAHAPWMAWLGGLCSFGFVLATVFAPPKLGAGLFVGLVVTASTITSLLLDHFGLLDFAVHPAGIGRIAGGLLMIAGFSLIAAF